MISEPDYTIEIDRLGDAIVVSCRNRSITASAARWATMTDDDISRDLGCLSKEGQRVRDAVALCDATARKRIILECWAWSIGPHGAAAAAA